MEKTNTPNYKTKYSKLTDFKNYVPDKEKEELKKLKNQKLKNPEDVYDLGTDRQMKFNNVTKTMQSLSSDEIADKLSAAEEAEEIEENFGRKYIKTFNETNNYGFGGHDSFRDNSPFIKNYGEDFPIDRIGIGQIICYKGTDYNVEENNGNILQLRTIGGNRVETVDNFEFKNKCCIRKEDYTENL